MIRKIITASALSLLCTATVSAHDVWFEPHDDDYRMIYGHPGEPEPYDPGKTQSVTAISAKGAKSEVSTRVRDEHLMADFPDNASLVVTSFDNGFWTEDPDGNHHNVSKQEVPGYKSSIHSTKFNKQLISWSRPAGKPVGAEFEIVPLSNPFSLDAGDELPVQLLYNSKPLADAEIEILGSMTLFHTDDDGKASLPISADSFQYILARHQEALNNHPDADALALETNLTFHR